MRRTTTLTALLLGATLLAPTGSASAAGETCRGEAATIVGTGAPVVGTPGRDVIVTGTSGDTDGGDGDDLICVTGQGSNSNLLDVYAGAGNDVVDSTGMSAGFYLSAYLGSGADTFTGGPGGDTVFTGEAADYQQTADAERDVVDTGAGSDTVFSGAAVRANADEVRLGDGDDGARWQGTAQSGAVLDAGEGDDGLTLAGSGTAYVLDLPAGVARADGVPQAGFTGFDYYTLADAPGDRTIEVVGTDGGDDITFDATARLVARLGGANDRLTGAPPLAGSTIDLGAGEDGVFLLAKDRGLGLDLEDRILEVDGQTVSTVSGVEDAYVIAREVRLEGDRGDNSLSWRGCEGRVEGGAGNDSIETTYDYIWETTFSCSSTKVVLTGGKGNDSIRGKLYSTKVTGGPGKDKLRGSSKDDVILGGAGRDRLEGKSGDDKLLGGAGRDQVNGSRGRDTCSAEVEKGCER